MATIPITRRGADKLKVELHRLKTVDRPWVINAIAEARAQGDLSENAEYEAAKDRQGFIEGRIQEVESKLSMAQVIDPTTLDAGGRVVFGATVELEDEASGEVVKYQIVGEDEADLKLGLVNIGSPIARALIGKEEGDTAEVIAPGGIRHFEIGAVNYLWGHDGLASRGYGLLVDGAAGAAQSALIAFFDADLLGFCALDLTAAREPLVAKHPQGLYFGALAAALAVLEDLDIARAGHLVFVGGTLLGRHWPPEHQQLADVLNRCGAEFFGQGLEHGFARSAVVGEDADLDQPMGIERGGNFFLDRVGQAIVADHDDRIEVVGQRAVFLSLGGG